MSVRTSLGRRGNVYSLRLAVCIRLWVGLINFLGNRSITLVTLARFVARLGGEAAFFIGVWGMAAYRFDATPSQIALLMGVLAVTSMIGSAFSGLLIDRYGPRNVLVGSQLVYVPIVLAVTRVNTMEGLIFACALFGISTAPIMTATGAFAPYLAEDRDGIERVNAYIETAGALSFVLGPAAGAVCARLYGIESVFYLDAIMTTLGVLLILPVATPPFARFEQRHPFAEMTDGLRVAYGLAPVRYYLLMGTLVWFSFGAFGALEPLFYRDVVKTGVEMIGYMNSAFGVGIAIGAWLLTRLPSNVTSARGLAYAVALVGLGAVGYVGTTNLVIIATGALVWGVFIGVVSPLLRTLMQLDAPEEYVGRVQGAAQVHRSAGEIVPLAVAPALAAAFGVQAVMIGGGLLATVFALGSLAHARRIDRSVARLPGRVRFDHGVTTDDPISPIT